MLRSLCVLTNFQNILCSVSLESVQIKLIKLLKLGCPSTYFQLSGYILQ